MESYSIAKGAQLGAPRPSRGPGGRPGREGMFVCRFTPVTWQKLTQHCKQLYFN